MSSILKLDSIEDKQKLQKALAEQINTDEAQGKLNTDIANLTRLVANIRESFQVTGAKLNAVDRKELDGGKTTWGPRWAGYRTRFEELLILSKDSASRIAAYSTEFENAVLRILSKEDVPKESKLTVLRGHIDKSRAFEGESTEMADKFRALIDDLEIFKSDFKVWTDALAKDIGDEMRRLDGEIIGLQRKIATLKDDITAVTLVSGILSLAFGLIPGCAIFCFIGALIALAWSTYEINRLNNEIEAADAQIKAKEQEKLDLAKRLDEVLAVQKEFEAEIADQIDNIKVGLGVFESIWRQIAQDCGDIADWLEKGAAEIDTPPIFYAYVEAGNTLYKGLAEALREYVRGIPAA